jgi:DNA-binding transcriptional LysR family regulator
MPNDAVRRRHGDTEHKAQQEMNLRQIEAFKALMFAGSVTGAAQMLNVSQPTISKLIAQLESENKLRLFTRTRGRLIPRREAHSLLKDVEKALNALEQVGRSASQLARTHIGHIRIACIPSIGAGFLPKAVASFMKTHPKTKVTLYARPSTYVIERVRSRLADMGFISQGPAAAGIVSTCFQETPGAICVLPPHHPLRRKKVLRAQDFVGQPFISVGRDTPFRYVIDRAFSDAGVQRNIVAEASHFATAYALAAEGVGITVIDPFSTVACFRKDSVYVRPFEPELKFVVNLLKPSNTPTPALAGEFLAHLAQEQRAMARTIKEMTSYGLPL